MLGPMFVHIRKDFATYHFFTSTLVGQRRQLVSLQAFGTDGEQALESALSATFTNAQHVRCFLHFGGNLERKLQELGYPGLSRMRSLKISWDTQASCSMA